MAALHTASTQVAELAAQAIAAGAPAPSLTDILTLLEPIASQDRSRAWQSPVAPRPEAAQPPNIPTGKALRSRPPILCHLLGTFAAHGDPEWLTMTQIADHLAVADPPTWNRWEGQQNRLIMVGRTIRSALQRTKLNIAQERLSGAIDPKRPTIYKLTSIRSAGGDFL
ncbi:hypothetical protein ACFVRD_47945 [Streptomyces sp. NPDC057908]|uniref:hypothetical protein n=1 Tax=Streptomyces sp. NPDC057908 TaxID=3346276 RepID=UPI0036EBC3DB